MSCSDVYVFVSTIDDCRRSSVLDYFVVVVGNEAKCAVLGDQPTQQLLNAWGRMPQILVRRVAAAFGVGQPKPERHHQGLFSYRVTMLIRCHFPIIVHQREQPKCYY
eukprot:scaffold9522_cov195-Skeletonema_dohrnii-CCMP3373.AAC.1